MGLRGGSGAAMISRAFGSIGETLPTHLVNLDALMKREDFAHVEAHQASSIDTDSSEVKLNDLTGQYAKLLRKGDFQRETSNWDAAKVVDLIECFLDGEVIPSIIMWQSDDSGNVFVIDGAHRISALLAWIHDDYGDGKKSKDFWGDTITFAQKGYAQATRNLVEEKIGSFEQLQKSFEDESLANGDQALLRRAKTSLKKKLKVQWIVGPPEVAEKAFFKINSKPSIIDPTERGILLTRKKPNAIATRAIKYAGAGHAYWGSFPSADVKNEIERRAKEIHGLLFEPISQQTRMTQPDWPIGGQSYSGSAMGMIFDLVNMVNGFTPAMWTGKRSSSVTMVLPDDADGQKTVAVLKKVWQSLALITGKYKQSLGLNPIVYCYGENARFYPPALLAVMKFVLELKDKDQLNEFTAVRHEFEELLIKIRYFVTHLGHAKGSGTRSIESIVMMYRIIFGELHSGNHDGDKIIRKILREPKLESLKAVYKKKVQENKRKSASTADKNAAYLGEVIGNPHRCRICQARLHSQSMSMDHRKRKQDGGTADRKNLQAAHFYCNTGYKESSVPKNKKVALSQ
jgi:hypothetical protein